MTKRAILNCVLISLLFSSIAPFFTLLIFVPAEGDTVYSYTDEDYEKLKEMPPEKAVEYTTTKVSTRKLKGLERITYMFSNPLSGLYLLKYSLLLFIPIFLATITTTYVNKKHYVTN